MDLLDPPMTEAERALLDRAAAILGSRWEDMTAEHLQEVSRREGIDFATAFLYDRLRRSPRHGSFIERVNALPGTAANVGTGMTLAVVPGAFYAEVKDSGADGAFVLEEAARLGFKTERVPLLSFGPLRDNARRLGDWLRDHRGERLVLVSLSKGGAEVKLAMEDPDAQRLFSPVRAWVDLCGLTQGTPMVDWLFRHPFRALLVRLLFWYRGYAYRALSELRRGPAGLLGGAWRLPAHLRVIHVAGFPLQQHLSRPLARRGHARVASLGPNDGGSTLLADLVSLPGWIYPVWGADHYLQPPWDIRLLMRRLFRLVGEECGERKDAS